MKRTLSRKDRKKIVFLIFIVALALYVFKDSHSPTVRTPNGTHFLLAIADTDEERMLGLGGRDTMGQDEGMLFMFPTPDIYSFWMKDMNFPLDIVWLAPISDEDRGISSSERKRVVVHIQENVDPSTYPELFTPTLPADYVLELSAGGVKRAGIEFGTVLTLENTPR